MDCRERGSHVRGVYPTQYTPHMRTARVKQEVGADTRIIVKEYSMKYRRKERGHYKWESTKQGITSAKDQHIDLPLEERESPTIY